MSGHAETLGKRQRNSRGQALLHSVPPSLPSHFTPLFRRQGRWEGATATMIVVMFGIENHHIKKYPKKTLQSEASEDKTSPHSPFSLTPTFSFVGFQDCALVGSTMHVSYTYSRRQYHTSYSSLPDRRIFAIDSIQYIAEPQFISSRHSPTCQSSHAKVRGWGMREGEGRGRTTSSRGNLRHIT